MFLNQLTQPITNRLLNNQQLKDEPQISFRKKKWKKKKTSVTIVTVSSHDPPG